MQLELERVTGSAWAPPWVRHAHLARYEFACDFVADRVAIDCACGDGTSSRMLATRASEVWAYDASPGAVDEARQANSAPNVAYEVADALELPVPDGLAGAYVSLETIEHLSDAAAFLREVVRVLAPSGVFVCSTPDREVCSPGNTIESRPWNRFHVREYSQREFVELLGGLFDEVVLFGQNPRSPSATRVKGFVGRRLSSPPVVRFNQAAKLPRLAYDRLEHHLVVPAKPNSRYEILVAVCRQRSRA